MDNRVLAVAVVVVVVVAAAAVYVVTSDNDDDSGMSIIGRVNTDGSGIFVKEGEDASKYVTIEYGSEPTAEDYYLGGEGTWVVFHIEAWGGSVFGVPAISSIQYVQLGQIAECMGLEFKLYVAGQTTSSNTLYYVANVSSYAAFESTLTSTPAMVGAIVWEPQFSIAIQSGCSEVATTNDMFPGHTCCIIGGTNEYLTNNEDTVVRFLAAYIETVEKMNEVIDAGEGEEYEYLIEVALDNVSITGLDDDEKRAAIESAFGYVVYTYSDDKTSNPLASLKDDIADLAVEFYDSSLVSNSYSDLGFDSAEDLAESFVDDSYIKQAFSYDKQSSYETTDTITVAVIAGDIHQLAIHYGIALGIFAEYGLNVQLSSQSAGPTVYNAINVGEADIGFLGAPPMTINAMNNGSITA